MHTIIALLLRASLQRQLQLLIREDDEFIPSRLQRSHITREQLRLLEACQEFEWWAPLWRVSVIVLVVMAYILLTGRGDDTWVYTLLSSNLFGDY